MNPLTDDTPLIDAALDSPTTLPTNDPEASDLLYPNTVSSQIERNEEKEGWSSRITLLSYEAWLARGGLKASVE